MSCCQSRHAHNAMPGSQLEIFEGSGLSRVRRPCALHRRRATCMDTARPAEYDQAALRARCFAGGAEATISLGRHPCLQY